jgi:hypothetical protein
MKNFTESSRKTQIPEPAERLEAHDHKK